MLDRRGGYEYEDLLACGRGELFGPGNAQLPLPPMLMFDRISEISETGGEYGKGLVRAELDVKPGSLVLRLPFQGRSGDAGMSRPRRTLADDGLFSGLDRRRGRGRALGLGELKFSGQVLPNVRKIVYNVDIKRVMRSRLGLGVADGWLSTDDEIIYRAKDLKVGLVKAGCRIAAGHIVSRLGRSDGFGSNVDTKTETRGRGDHEAGCHHGDGHRLIDRKQHPGSAFEPS